LRIRDAFVQQGVDIKSDYSLLIRLAVELDDENLMRQADDFTLSSGSNVFDIICKLEAITQLRDTVGDEFMHKKGTEITTKLTRDNNYSEDTPR
jgi:hypothetical protein